MNLMAYDMMCVGNNEFKATDGTESQQMMLLLMRRSRFPWLAANLTVGKTGIPPEGIHPFIVRDFNGLRVGFLGLTAPRSSEYPQTAGWTITDPIESAAHWVPLARKECDVLVAVTHIGAEMDEQLAAKVAGIDAIVGGDSHTFISKARMVRSPDGTSVPIVQAGEQGIVLGRLDLAFERTANVWRVTKVDSSLMPMTSAITEDPAMKSLLARWLELPAKSATDPVTSSMLIPAFQY
jgi:5'-nucleotidase